MGLIHFAELFYKNNSTVDIVTHNSIIFHPIIHFSKYFFFPNYKPGKCKRQTILKSNLRNCIFNANSNLLIPISLQPESANLGI